jgi:hypothetical protein
MKMGEIDIQDYARQLLEAHGDKAVAEATQKASTFESPCADRPGQPGFGILEGGGRA